MHGCLRIPLTVALLSLTGLAARGSAQAPPPAGATSSDVTVRAINLTEPLSLDGRLDEEVYRTVAGATDFIQQVPREGSPATERTEAWVIFDADTIYVSGRCWDSAPPDKWVANELRRDTNQLRQNDTFGVIFDTFHDRRNGFLFYTNPLGGASRSGGDRRRQPQRRLEPGVGRAHRPVRRRLDRRDGDSVQVAALHLAASTRCGASTCGASSAARTSGRT